MKILHFWSKGRHVGDFFYARAQQRLLRCCLGDVEVWETTCARHDPGDEGITRDGLMERADAVIVGGGPLYDLMGGGGNLFVREEDLVSCGKPIIVWSTGLDAKLDNHGRPIIWEAPPMSNIHALHRVATSAAVRDRGTQSYLRSLGYDSEVTGDAAHFLADLQLVKHRDGPVLFSWRHDLCEPLTDTVAKWLRWATLKGVDVRMVCLSAADAESAKRIGFPYFYADQDVDRYIELLGSASAVLGCRMHAAIVALIQGVPAHCFYYTTRIKFWGDDFFGPGKWILPLSEMTVDKLCELTEQLLAGNLSVFDPFTQRVNHLRLKTESWLQSLFLVGKDYGTLPEILQSPHHEESYEDHRQERRAKWLVENSVGSVLELGCAEGYILDQVGRPGCCGVDFDQDRITEGKRKYPGITFYVMDIRYGLPFSDESFDTVLAAEILEHMDFSDAVNVLRDAFRVAREKVLITLPYAGGEDSDPALVHTRDHMWVPDDEHIAQLLEGYSKEREEFRDGFAFITIRRGA